MQYNISFDVCAILILAHMPGIAVGEPEAVKKAVFKIKA